MRIAFGYKAQSGKDTAADYLIEKYSGFNLKFAAPLKTLASYIQRFVGFPEEKDRELLQWLGTDYGRTRREDVWVDLMENKIDQIDVGHNIFISDLRFENEAAMLKRKGFVLVKVTREIGNLPGSGSVHVSEQALANYEGWDFEIKNFHDMAYYEEQVELLVEKVTGQDHRLLYRKTLEIR